MSIYEDVSYRPFNVLDEREKVILALTLEGLTLEQIADNLDISKERVRQAKLKAYARLKNQYAVYFRNRR